MSLNVDVLLEALAVASADGPATAAQVAKAYRRAAGDESAGSVPTYVVRDRLDALANLHRIRCVPVERGPNRFEVSDRTGD